MTDKNTKRKKKNKYLEMWCKKLQLENQILKALKEPSVEEKIKVLEDYFKWCNKKEYNSSYIETFFEYKDYLERRGDKWKGI